MGLRILLMTFESSWTDTYPLPRVFRGTSSLGKGYWERSCIFYGVGKAWVVSFLCILCILGWDGGFIGRQDRTVSNMHIPPFGSLSAGFFPFFLFYY